MKKKLVKRKSKFDKLSPELQNDIERYYLDSETATIIDTANHFGVSRATVGNLSVKYGWAKKKTKKYNGRTHAYKPHKYDPKYCDDLIVHMSKGYSFETFAAEVDCTAETLYQWVKKYEKFADAKKRGEVKAQRFFESIGMMGLNGKIDKFNSTVWVFSMKNKFNWADKVETKGEIKHEEVISKEDEDRYQKMLKDAEDQEEGYWKRKYQKEVEKK